MTAPAGPRKGDLRSRALRNDRSGIGGRHGCNDALFFCLFDQASARVDDSGSTSIAQLCLHELGRSPNAPRRKRTTSPKTSSLLMPQREAALQLGYDPSNKWAVALALPNAQRPTRECGPAL